MKRKKTLSAVPMGLFFEFSSRKVRKMRKVFSCYRYSCYRANGMGMLRCFDKLSNLSLGSEAQQSRSGELREAKGLAG